jgi:DMSO reductase anchor subunit
MLLLGTTSLIVILLMDLRFSESENPKDLGIRVQIIKKASIWLTIGATISGILVIALGLYQIENLRAIGEPSAQASLRLLLDLYQPLLVMRIGLTALGIIWLIVVISFTLRTQRSFMNLLGPVYIACIMVLVGEIIERFLFYATHVRIGI